MYLFLLQCQKKHTFFLLFVQRITSANYTRPENFQIRHVDQCGERSDPVLAFSRDSEKIIANNNTSHKATHVCCTKTVT